MQELTAYGNRLLDGKDYAAAVAAFDTVLAIAPRAYTPCMQSLLGRSEAQFALGKRALGGSDSRQEFAWGRGVRWPGWYIIAAILFRNEIVKGM